MADPSGPARFFVRSDAGDGGNGSLERPFRSIEEARDGLRAARAAGRLRGGARVEIEGGEYRIEEPIRFGPEDSGGPGAPVVFAGSEAKEARLIGGRRITDFEPVADARILARLPAGARERVRVADLRAHRVTDFGELQPRGFGGSGTAALELFWEGKPMTLARWPNQGWMTIASTPEGADGSVIGYEGDRPSRWTEAEDGWLFGYWFHGWADQFLPLAAVDPGAKTLRLGEKHGYGLREGQRFFALNLLEELDAPGEWHLDRESGRLYFWPPESEGRVECLASILQGPLIECEGASYIRFENLVLEATRGDGASIRGGEGVELAGCAIRNVGAWAVTISGGSGHRVVSCDIAYPGEGGIALEGGDRESLTPAGHEALNNHIHHFGRTRRTYQPGVRLGGVGSRAAHNFVHDAPHMAIGFGGNDHVIEYNEVSRVLLETDDAGAAYIGRNWTTRGHQIRFNYFHHSGPWHAPVPAASERREEHVVHEPLHRHGVNLLYFDDAASGITVFGNVLHDGGRAVMIGGGRDHYVANNLILGGEIGVWVDARGVGWAREHIRPGGGWRMREKLREVRYDEPPYSVRYPGLATILEEEPHKPLGNRIEKNIFAGVNEWRRFQGTDADEVSFADNLPDADLPFDDPPAAVRALSEKVREKIGFEAIPFEKIGLQKDEFRKQLP